jgi:hypothetical protein
MAARECGEGGGGGTQAVRQKYRREKVQIKIKILMTNKFKCSSPSYEAEYYVSLQNCSSVLEIGTVIFVTSALLVSDGYIGPLSTQLFAYHI